MEEILDRLEKVEQGPACLVTVSAGKKAFSTGFDLKYWNEDLFNSAITIPRFQVMVGRLARLAMPTMCVISGHCFAGGLFFALAHDFRIMTDSKRAVVSLSEINIGLLMTPWYVDFLKEMTLPQTMRTLALGKYLSSREAVDMEIISYLYSDSDDAEKHIAAFIARFGSQSEHHKAISVLKSRIL